MMNNNPIVKKALPFIVIFAVTLIYGLYTYVQSNAQLTQANAQDTFAQITPVRNPVIKNSSWSWTLLLIRNNDSATNSTAKYIVNWCGESAGASGQTTGLACDPSLATGDFISELKSEFVNLKGKNVTTNIQHESVDCGRVVINVKSDETTIQSNSFDTGKNCPRTGGTFVNALGETNNLAYINRDTDGSDNIITKILDLLEGFDIDYDSEEDGISITPAPAPGQRHLCRTDEPAGKRLRGQPNYCDDACCGADGECPNGQKCSIANGECQTNSSCDPNSGTPPPQGTVGPGDVAAITNLMANILTHCKHPDPRFQNTGLITRATMSCVGRFTNVSQATKNLITASADRYGSFQCVAKAKADISEARAGDSLLSHFTGEATARSYFYRPPSGYQRNYFQPGQRLTNANIKPGDIMIFDYNLNSAGHIMFVIKVQTNSAGEVDVITVNEANTLTSGDVRNSSYPLSLIYSRLTQGKWRAAGWLSRN